MAARSKLEEARLQGEPEIVKMDKVGYISFTFSATGKSIVLVCTEDLNSCTAVTIPLPVLYHQTPTKLYEMTKPR